MSIMSLLLCFTMLMGATFAWFTDTVKSSGNIIKSGTLDVEMYWAEGKADPNANTTTWTDASTGAIFNNDLWEPGYTEVRHIKIENKGSLALKYQLNIFANGDVSDLADVIDVYFVDPAVQVQDRTALDGIEPEGTLTEILAEMPDNASGDLTAGESDTVTIALKMREEAGNEYQNKAIGSDFVVQLLATQLTYEKDSFDEFYDKDSEFLPVNESVSIVNNNGTLGEAVVMTADMPYGTIKVTVPAGAQLSTADVSSLKLTVKNAASNYSGQLTTNQVATGYEIYVDGIADYINPFVDGTRKLYNTSSKKITVELPIGAGRNDVKVYQDNNDLNGTYGDTGVVTFSTQYFTPFSQAKKSTINVVYTKLSEAEKELNETLENITAGESVTINSTADNMVSVNNIADALNGSSDVELVGNGTGSTTVAANNATITANSLTVKDMTIQATGTTTIKGDNTTIESVEYQHAGGSYGLTVSGSGATVKDTTISGVASQALVTLDAPASSAATISGTTIHETGTWGVGNGVTVTNLDGTVDIDDSDISVGGWALQLGNTSSTVKGTVDIANTKINSTGLTVRNVVEANFTEVTFANTWRGSSISFEIGGTTNTFTGCDFQTAVNFMRCGTVNRSLTFIFNNCKYNGTDITADNFQTYFDFSSVASANTRITVIVNGTTVTIK